ncbi:MAG TPA: ABC transporter permease [Kiloniellaceae bacterium]|nr:ABC transporter permease [Kiloniellaceae bacterium]
MTADALSNPKAGLAPEEAIDEISAEKRRVRRCWQLLSPALITIGVFGCLPLVIALIYSFLEPATYGGVVWNFSTDAYVQLLFDRDIFDDSLIFNPAYLEIFSRSFLLALFTMAVSLLIGFPTAYYMATRPPSQRDLWVFLITIPFWTNLLIRTFSMQLIIRDEGLINVLLMDWGLIEKPLELIYTDFAVALGLLYSYLPFMVLPIYAALERVDFRLVEAGFDLYANRFKVLKRIIVPLAMPGIIAGCILVLIPALGAYITPVLLGGGKELMIGNLIAQQFGSSRNWPLGSAAAMVLLAMVLLALVIYVKVTGRRGGPAHG